MNGEHWTQQDLIDHVYGLSAKAGHLDACPQCRERWLEVRAVRDNIVREPEVERDVLAAQRRAIYRRLGREPRPATARLIPAFAAVLLLVTGSLFIGQAPHPGTPAAPAVSDAQLFADIYAVEQSSEPHVAKPMRALFEEN